MSNKLIRMMKYLVKNNDITSLQAIRELGDTRVSDTVYRLKKDLGIDITCQRVQVRNRFKEKCSVGVYKFANKRAEQKAIKYLEGVSNE